MIIGTCHFVSIEAAYRFYGYGFTKKEVDQKLIDGEIAIGWPKLKEGQYMFVDQREQRYFIQDDK